MNFIADLHIHSRFSMASSRSLNIRELAAWGAAKGITVLSTGDFTHPAWRAELKAGLVRDEHTGLYKSKKATGKIEPEGPYFLPGAEISCVYKQNGKTRKVHNLVFAPDFEIADKISLKLEKIGRLDGDGRPILKLGSRDLLEIILTASPDCVLIPAHIWTPWYSLFGSRSGFNSLEDCYGDLSGHIFALETGLSSDPAMNRLWGNLDKYALVSNSDAHSGANLGREANIFQGEATWHGIFDALRASAKREIPEHAACAFLGTLEFFPEEGKYHLDGHRNCGVSLTPAESAKLGDICPNCGKPLTIGVLHRIMELADRTEAPELPNEPGFACVTPLAMIVAELLGSAPQSQKTRRICQAAITALGPELNTLCASSTHNIAEWWEPLGEAIKRMRQGKINIQAGFDGQYGLISLFDKDELEQMRKHCPPPKV